MQMNQIRYMVTAARLGSFSRAAEELFVTQPTLSQQIHKLEEEIGTPLFFRHSKSVSLTEAGSVFYEYGYRVLNDTDQVLEKMHGYKTLEHGRIRLGVFWIFTYLNLADNLHCFNEDYPGLDLHLQLGSSNALLKQLHRHELDAVICITTPDEESLRENHFRLLHRDVMAVIVHKDNPLSHRDHLTITDMEGQNVIMPASDTPLYDTIQQQLTAGGIHFHEVCQSSHNEINAQMVSQNFAVSFSSTAVAEKTNTGQFLTVPLLPPIQRDVYLVVPRFQLDNPAIQTLMEYLPEIS